MRSSIQWPENYLETEGQLAGMIDHQSMGNRLTKIYTRTGDAGLTGLASGDRVAKFDPRIEASGTVDETNCAIGVVLSEKGIPDDVRTCLRRIQNELFDLGAEFSLPEYRAISADHVERLEAELDAFNSSLPPLKEFILPGGCPGAASCHLARTVCRRAERAAWALADRMTVSPDLLKYLNRLSDLLFVAARSIAQQQGEAEELWEHER